MSEAKLFVGGVPFDWTQEQFRQSFVEVGGDVIDAFVPLQKNRGDKPISRGIGFVTYATLEQAKNAMDVCLLSIDNLRQIMNEKLFMTSTGKEVKLRVSPANERLPTLPDTNVGGDGLGLSSSRGGYHSGGGFRGGSGGFDRNERGNGRDNRGYGKEDRGGYGRDSRGYFKENRGGYGRDERDVSGRDNGYERGGYGRDDRRDDRLYGGRDERRDDRGYDGRDDRVYAGRDDRRDDRGYPGRDDRSREYIDRYRDVRDRDPERPHRSDDRRDAHGYYERDRR